MCEQRAAQSRAYAEFNPLVAQINELQPAAVVQPSGERTCEARWFVMHKVLLHMERAFSREMVEMAIGHSTTFHVSTTTKTSDDNNMLNENNNVNAPTTPVASGSDTSRGVWSQEEHDKFLEALQKYPNGPWKAVAEHVGTRSVRQVQTHAQKYHEKVARRLRGLRKDRKRVQRPEHRLDDDMIEICNDLQNDNALLAPKPAGKRRRQRSAKGVAVVDANVDESREHGHNVVFDAAEETKLSETMDGVHVSDVHEGKAIDDWLSVIEPADTPLDDLDADESFFEIIDYLIEALSSSESESEQ